MKKLGIYEYLTEETFGSSTVSVKERNASNDGHELGGEYQDNILYHNTVLQYHPHELPNYYTWKYNILVFVFRTLKCGFTDE
jgi:hypothetical protein